MQLKTSEMVLAFNYCHKASYQILALVRVEAVKLMWETYFLCNKKTAAGILSCFEKEAYTLTIEKCKLRSVPLSIKLSKNILKPEIERLEAVL